MTVRTQPIATRGTRVQVEDDPIIVTFVAELGALWPDVAPWCLDPGPDVADVPTRPTGHTHGARDLDALLAGWPHFGPSERAVLSGALGYLGGPAGENDGVAPLVVDATVRALLRGPRH